MLTFGSVASPRDEKELIEELHEQGLTTVSWCASHGVFMTDGGCHDCRPEMEPVPSGVVL